MVRNILVIDDEEIILKTLGKYLKRNGYNAETVNNGAAAIEKVKKSHYDLIISDMRMPDMNGVETLRRIKRYLQEENKNKIPAVIITGYSDVEESYQAAETLVVDYLYKPFELDELTNIIRKNLESTPAYKRIHQRIHVDFPARIKIEDSIPGSLEKMSGRIIDISESGLCLNSKENFLENSLLNIIINAEPFSRSLILRGKVVWYKFINESNGSHYGICFNESTEENISILRNILFKYKFLDERFISLTKNMETFIKNLKDELDEFDRLNDSDINKQIQFINDNKKDIFNELDYKFQKVWEIVKDFPKDKYLSHQYYYQNILGPLFLEPIEINRRIYEKPLGYSGDYVTMNYIFNYHDGNYLGETLFQKLINNYACNVPISCSNIQRKNYLKEKILKVLQNEKEAKIASLGSGPARELIELLEENKIDKPLVFKCVDLEKTALDFVKCEIDKVASDKKRFLSIDYIHKDLVAVVRDKTLQKEFEGCNLIYVSGVYDYLRDRMASSITKSLCNLLQKGGELIIINASLEKSSHRACYELLGGWDLVYRTELELLNWTKDIQSCSKIVFETPSPDNKYLFLNIKKL